MDEQKKKPASGTEASGTPRKAKKAYKKPGLVEYGSIARLTHSGGSTTTELGSPKKNKKTCL